MYLNELQRQEWSAHYPGPELTGPAALRVPVARPAAGIPSLSADTQLQARSCTGLQERSPDKRLSSSAPSPRLSSYAHAWLSSGLRSAPLVTQKLHVKL